MASLSDEISSRRTFAIISHPDAGKTTLTEKLLLYTGSIQTAGSVKGKSSAKHAVSDWMDIEKERGISVTSSVLQFTYNGACVNILDTPGHQDFSEDTYRTLMAADAAVMVIDGAKGVEAQTKKLFKVCTLRHIPIFTFVNKLDHEARDPFELMEEIENVLGINTYPMNWPIGSGRNFRGVFDRQTRRVIAFEGDGHANATKKVAEVEAELGDPSMDELIGEENHKNLMDDIELLDGAGDELDLDAVACGKLSPAFFGSALTNFGVEPFLKEFLRLAPTPRAYTDTLTSEPVDPCRDDFSGFVFKIQANMDKNHRDRIAFVRICSGKFERGMDAFHVQGNRKLKLATGTSMMADDRAIVDEAYAGDIVGLFDPGIFSIGDTVCSGKRHVQYPQIPTFAPEMFARITQVDTLKRKQPRRAPSRSSANWVPAWRASSWAWSAYCSLRCSSAASRPSIVLRFVASRCPIRTSAGSRTTPTPSISRTFRSRATPCASRTCAAVSCCCSRARGTWIGQLTTTPTLSCRSLATWPFNESARWPCGAAAPFTCLMPCERLSYPPSSQDRDVRAVRVRYPAR